MPKIKIIGIEDDLNKWNQEEIILKMELQNKLETNRTDFKMKVVKITQKTEKEGTMIMEVDPLTHKGIVEKGKLIIGRYTEYTIL